MPHVAVRMVPAVAPPVPDALPVFLKLIADPNRLRILALLARGERCVCHIEAALALPQNLVSHHLSVLKRAGLVLDRREGRWVYYRLDVPMLAGRLTALATLLESRQAAMPDAEEQAVVYEETVARPSRTSPATVEREV